MRAGRVFERLRVLPGHFVVHGQFALAAGARFCAAGKGFTLLFKLSFPMVTRTIGGAPDVAS